MNVIIKNIESSLRNIECEEVEYVYDVEHLSLLVQLLEMIDDYKDNHGEMPGTIKDLLEWKNTLHEVKLPFE